MTKIEYIEGHFYKGRYIEHKMPGEYISPGKLTYRGKDGKWYVKKTREERVQAAIKYLEERISLRQGQINFIDTFGGYRSSEKPKYQEMLGDLKLALWHLEEH